jgi:choline dehydrogenase-like flavoprotein
MRSTKRDYDTWPNSGVQKSSWTWDGLLPSFKKAMYVPDPDPAYAKEFNLTYDPAAWGQYESTRVFATFSPQFGDNKKTMYTAIKSIPEIEIPKDINAGTPGLGWYAVSMEPEAPYSRSDSRTGHWDGLHRRNYDIVVGMKANKILFKGKRVSAVRFIPKEGGAAVTVKARREINLSAGALHSPHILMLSGIGPEKALKSLGKQVKVDYQASDKTFRTTPQGH